MSSGGHTRRRFLQGAAGVAAGLAASRAGVFEVGEAFAGNGDGYAGELKLFAADFAPTGYLPCEGQRLNPREYPDLDQAIGRTFGGRGGDIEAPDLRSRAAAGSGTVPDGPGYRVGDYGNTLAVRDRDESPSTLGMTYMINPGTRDRLVLGEVRAFGYDYAPGRGWTGSNGQELRINSRNGNLYSLIGTRFGGDGRETFRLPDLRTATPVGAGDPEVLPKTGFAERRVDLAPGGADRRPRLHVNYCIATDGDYPQQPSGAPGPGPGDQSGGDFIGEIRPFGGDLPRDWLPCDGRTVPLNRYQPLWAAIGTRFGGDGETTLGLPDLRGRATAGTDSRRKQDVGDTSGLGTPPPKLLPFVVVNWGIRSFGDFPERGR